MRGLSAPYAKLAIMDDTTNNATNRFMLFFPARRFFDRSFQAISLRKLPVFDGKFAAEERTSRFENSPVKAELQLWAIIYPRIGKIESRLTHPSEEESAVRTRNHEPRDSNNLIR